MASFAISLVEDASGVLLGIFGDMAMVASLGLLKSLTAIPLFAAAFGF